MLGNNCEKMVLISPTTYNKWTQTQIDDHKVSMASSGRVMEKPNQELLQQQQQALRCPRCDSSNTKFCYYNNYSLSQPRHFCKACKRYWTRGGTLRNVPVGGGCRKNKRVKRPTSSSTIDVATTTTTAVSPSSSSTPSANSKPPSQPHIDIASSTTSNHINPLFYGLPGIGNSCDVMNLQFPRFNSRVSAGSGYDLQPHLNTLGLGFSSGVLSSEVNDNNGYRNGFSSNNNTFLASYNSIFGSSSTSMPSTPVMASLLSSTLLQQKFLSGGNGVKGDPGNNAFHQGLMTPLEEMHHGSEGGMVALKEVKVEGQNRLAWNNSNNNNGGACQNQIEHMGLLSDPSLYWNNTATTAFGAWSDQPNNIGPSVTPLI